VHPSVFTLPAIGRPVQEAVNSPPMGMPVRAAVSSLSGHRGSFPEQSRLSSPRGGHRSADEISYGNAKNQYKRDFNLI
jgi:hypothetical protein